MSRLRLAIFFVSGVALVLAVVVLDRNVSDSVIERRSQDLRVAAVRAMFATDNSRVVIVSIDQASVDATRRSWPWPRALVARLLEKTAQAGPAAIGVVLPRFQIPPLPPASAPGPDPIQTVASQYPVVCFASRMEFITGEAPHLTLPDVASAHSGFLGFFPDSDGVVRRFMPQYEGGGALFPSLPLMLYRLAGNDPEAWPPNLPYESNGTFPVQFSGPPGTLVPLSAHRVLEGLDVDRLQGKVVILGNTLDGEGQAYSTPFLELPARQGVAMGSSELLANCVGTMFGSAPIHPLEGHSRTALLVGVAVLGWLLYVLLGPGTGFATMIFFVFLYTVGVAADAVYRQELMPLALPVAALVAGYFSSVVIKGVLAAVRV